MSAPHDVKIFAVRKYGTKGGARVHASVDGGRVMWDPSGPTGGGWLCDQCGDADLTYCPHVDAVEAILAPSVLGEWAAS